MYNIDKNSAIIINLAIILISGFIFTRLTKKLKLPNVTGYIITGILIGPYTLNLIPKEFVTNIDFVTDIALAFIAFGTGKYFKLDELKKNGLSIFIMTLFESLTAALFVILAMIFIFKLPFAFSIMLGAIGSATAPASTIMTIRQYKAKGEFVNTILQIVALDDGIAIIAFSVCTAIIKTMESSVKVNIMSLIEPIVINISLIGVGVILIFILNKLLKFKSSHDSKLILVLSMLLFVTGFCSIFGVSPLLSCLIMGIVYTNTNKDKSIFKGLNHFTPPILALFFIISGMKLDISMLKSAGVIGIGYFIIRIIGKYLGAYTGACICKKSKEIKYYLGLALIPQAGVSIGLVSLGQRLLPDDMGKLLSTIILSSAVLYEMIGPACAKLALTLSNSFERGESNKNIQSNK